ncbi:MAG: DNA-deoxyinosine glycosylase, partial [Clostridia bacterium]|nr:DNA-deoxyinosine glycosylase [Clostridia bacterium]
MPEKNSMKKQQNIVTHPFGPVYDCNSTVLVLGTLPSDRSREDGLYLAHPTNQFWRLSAAV